MDIEAENKILRALLREKNIEFKHLLEKEVTHSKCIDSCINRKSSVEEKTKLYLEYFKGSDILAKRWQSNKTQKVGYSLYCKNEFLSVCNKPKIKCLSCNYQNYVNLNAQGVYDHLSGKEQLGIYPLIKGDLCGFICFDFDKKNFKENTSALAETLTEYKIKFLIEVSQSGNGCHVWIFFKELILAKIARKFGFLMLDKTIEKANNVGLDSYDRIFPSQDICSKEGYGNLIHLPLHREKIKENKTCFVDANFKKYEDQWLALDNCGKNETEVILELSKLHVLISSSKSNTTINPKKLKITKADILIENLHIRISNFIIIKRSDISIRLLKKLMYMSSYPNPAFYEAQRFRRPIYNLSPLIKEFKLDEKYIYLPRGLEKQLLDLLNRFNPTIDNKTSSKTIELDFTGNLRENQAESYEKIISRKGGVINLATGSGKTILALKMIADLKMSTCILVPNQTILEQWIQQIENFLDIKTIVLKKLKTKNKLISSVGIILGSKKKPTYVIDVCSVQTVVNMENSIYFAHKYGLVIVDEAHHIAANAFKNSIIKFKPKYLFGLSATPYRSDGATALIGCYLGENIFDKISFDHELEAEVQFIEYKQKFKTNVNNPTYLELVKVMTTDKDRNLLIKEHVDFQKRQLVLTQSVQHAKDLNKLIKKSILVTGEVKNKSEIFQKLRKKRSGYVVIGTTQLIGEGFDLETLDSLIFATPVKFEGRVTQIVGRLLRKSKLKSSVEVIDIVDSYYPMFRNQYYSRVSTYENLKFRYEKLDF